jgi:site-specific DNA-methyltransferase (adenine-specific)
MQTDVVYNQDCLEGMRSISDGTIDIVVSDPPYLMNYKTSYRKNKVHKFCTPILGDSNESLIREYIKECYRVLKDNSAIYVFCNFNKIDIFKQEIGEYFKIKNIIVWVKNAWTAGDLKNAYGKQYEFIIYANKGLRPINGKRVTDVWEFNRIYNLKLLH